MHTASRCAISSEDLSEVVTKIGRSNTQNRKIVIIWNTAFDGNFRTRNRKRALGAGSTFERTDYNVVVVVVREWRAGHPAGASQLRVVVK